MSVPPVTGWLDAVMVSLTAALITFLSFIPALIGAIIILVVGWFLSGLLARLLVGILERVGFERAAEKTGISGFIARTGVRDARASRVVGELVKWFIRLIFIEAAATALQLTAVTDVINRVVLFIPNLIVALILLMIGALIARFVGDLVRGSASEMGFGNPNMLASLARAAIMAFAVLVAINQIGIAASLVNTLFMGIVFAFALAAGLAFGLGGRETAGRIWQSWYQRGSEMAPRLEQAAQTSAQRVESTERRMEPQMGSSPEPMQPERRPAQPEQTEQTEQRPRYRPTSE